MNQTALRVKLRDFTTTSQPFGNVQGKEVYQKLSEFISKHPDACVLGISLEGIEATDASFPRESVLSVAKQFRRERGLFLEHLDDRDLIDNWKYAAQAKEQPLVIWRGDSFEVIGPDMSSSSRELLNYVLKHRSVLASQVAADLDLSVQNASTRLKKLVDDGYILRVEDIASSGGIEYKYIAIH
ncbi:winged helix-turn-helix transcriptional regulator [Burkholderia anthina]|uniref:winged helix-turn-helix transcriptional regulator n=1 Tax=Burkholderia anthina TaxID=179879 RepID=UPI000F595080|nr:winged helix-turn-helix domain-containing protein [Burkholderia anthina]RQV78342.1 MarR family transcriptional regulator [Burkholderia anthina]